MTTEQRQSRASGVARATVGVVLFIIWGILTILWVYDAIYELVHGEAGPAIKAVIWLLLMLLLAGMEGLEVAVIDRWSHLYPDRAMSDLGDWLAARQVFVALIVTAATILAGRATRSRSHSCRRRSRHQPRSRSSTWCGQGLRCCGSCRSSRSTWPRQMRTATSP